MKSLLLKSLSLILAIILFASMLPFAAFANDNTAAPEYITSTETPEERFCEVRAEREMLEALQNAPPSAFAPMNIAQFTPRYTAEQPLIRMAYTFRTTVDAIRAANGFPASQTQVGVGTTVNIPAANPPLHTRNLGSGAYYIRNVATGEYLSVNGNQINLQNTAGANQRWNISFPFGNFESTAISPTTGATRFLHGTWGGVNFDFTLHPTNNPPHLMTAFLFMPEFDNVTNTRFRITNAIGGISLVSRGSGNIGWSSANADGGDHHWWTIHYVTPPTMNVSVTPNNTATLTVGSTRNHTATVTGWPRQDITPRVIPNHMECLTLFSRYCQLKRRCHRSRPRHGHNHRVNTRSFRICHHQCNTTRYRRQYQYA